MMADGKMLNIVVGEVETILIVFSLRLQHKSTAL